MTRQASKQIVAVTISAVALVAAWRIAGVGTGFGDGDGTVAMAAGDGERGERHYRGRLGKNSPKVIERDGKTLLWASGDPDNPDEARWYDYTGSPIPAKKLQFGIGKDAIPSIDDPLFVKPTDERLRRLPVSHYRPNERVRKVDDVRVIGYVVDGEARAYPTALLDRHELVNDKVGGKPVTVGW